MRATVWHYAQNVFDFAQTLQGCWPWEMIRENDFFGFLTNFEARLATLLANFGPKIAKNPIFNRKASFLTSFEPGDRGESKSVKKIDFRPLGLKLWLHL